MGVRDIGGPGVEAATEQLPQMDEVSGPDWDEPPTVTVPATPDGLAVALSSLAAAHRSPGPERSHPAGRAHPPLVSFGELDVPTPVQDAIPETGITVRLPRSVDHLYVVAPLAYYLGARVVLADRPHPVLTAAGVGLKHEFDPLPDFQASVADLVRRCFYLDSLLRNGRGRSGTIDELPLDATEIRSRGPAGRLAAYLAVPDAVLEARLPTWHLATYVEPTVDRGRALPHLLDALSLVYLPEATPADGPERLRWSLDSFVRDAARVPSVDVVAPALGSGELHAWLAEGAPLEAHKTTETALRSRLEARGGDGPFRVAVVLNDDAMAREAAVADTYRAGPTTVTVHEDLTREELAAVLGTDNDLVHFMGHCDVDGLRCRNGPLAARELTPVRTRAVFLNACGSYHEGLALVENGCSAGAVTLGAVLDDQATTVGTTFARLVSQGFGMARALKLARRRIVTGQDYAVVGDGTHAVVEGDPPAVLRVDSAGRQYRVRVEVPAGRRPGRRYRDPFTGDTELRGVPAEATVDRTELRRLLADRPEPAVHDGQFVWAEDLAEELAA